MCRLWPLTWGDPYLEETGSRPLLLPPSRSSHPPDCTRKSCFCLHYSTSCGARAKMLMWEGRPRPRALALAACTCHSSLVQIPIHGFVFSTENWRKEKKTRWNLYCGCSQKEVAWEAFEVLRHLLLESCCLPHKTCRTIPFLILDQFDVFFSPKMPEANYLLSVSWGYIKVRLLFSEPFWIYSVVIVDVDEKTEIIGYCVLPGIYI